MLFEVQTRSEGDVDVVSVLGDVDLASLPRLAAAFGAVDRDVRVDLTEVDWFDPMCLGVLITADLRARRGGCTLTVTASEAVASLLSETRLDRLFDMSASS